MVEVGLTPPKISRSRQAAKAYAFTTSVVQVVHHFCMHLQGIDAPALRMRACSMRRGGTHELPSADPSRLCNLAFADRDDPWRANRRSASRIELDLTGDTPECWQIELGVPGRAGRASAEPEPWSFSRARL